MKDALQDLSRQLNGELFTDLTMRTLYATDASAYREMPLAVAIPADINDIKKLISFASENNTSIIPRTAGTSLAGQVVGNGIVVDVSKNFTKIIEINKEENWVRVQPGVIRDELNLFLKDHGYFFGPETSTANRAMIAGMVGNNSCGSNSIIYGSTRDHLLSVNAILSDGSEVAFSEHSYKNLDKSHNEYEKEIYSKTFQILSQVDNQTEIKNNFPKSSIKRRNTGYAIDMLVDSQPFNPEGDEFNFCKLIAGSEGTLCFITEIKLNISPLPPKETGLVCVHFNNVDESLRANLIALKYKPSASELIDHYILECTKNNIEQQKNRFFVQGDPGAILVVEFVRNTREEIMQIAAAMEREMSALGLGYHFPLLFGDDTKKIWTLRKAGLGLLSNLPGDEKAVAVIEDTAVAVEDLPDYIKEFNEILKKHGMFAVHYAHAGSGELHLRPIINLKTKEGHLQFRLIADEIAGLVKKYKGSLSGEHGDGRLRGEFIKRMVGEKNYLMMKEIKNIFDPGNIFNPGKIVDTPPMDSFLRYEAGQQIPKLNTYFRYYDQNVLQHAEQCNGSGDCRKTALSGGTMCPSYMATRNEKDTTRARANILREFLTHSEKTNRYDHKEIKEVMDLCLSCKGCKSECPSNVDVAKLKAEFLQNYYDANGIPLRSWLIGNFTKLSSFASIAPWAYNFIFGNSFLRKIANNIVGFHPQRTMPLLANKTLKNWFEARENKTGSDKKVYLFCDEFTNYNDVEIGKKAVFLLEKLGYEVIIPTHIQSGRAFLSKGMLKEGKKIANKNVELLKNIVTGEIPLIGIEPSAILTFRDEYPDLVEDHLFEDAKKLAKNVLLIDEFLAGEVDKGKIKPENFIADKRLIKLHGHCQQKSMSSMVFTKKILSMPKNYEVQLIPSGCCGMAGSFGYEKEHYEISMKIGGLVLFPTINKQADEVIIAAPGTSCRHQIHDGTGRKAMHPVEILWEAIIK